MTLIELTLITGAPFYCQPEQVVSVHPHGGYVAPEYRDIGDITEIHLASPSDGGWYVIGNATEIAARINGTTDA